MPARLCAGLHQMDGVLVGWLGVEGFEEMDDFMGNHPLHAEGIHPNKLLTELEEIIPLRC